MYAKIAWARVDKLLKISAYSYETLLKRFRPNLGGGEKCPLQIG
jgi:hypothetical protein